MGMFPITKVWLKNSIYTVKNAVQKPKSFLRKIVVIPYHMLLEKS